MLKYNIDFEIMGVLITLVVWIYYRMNYVRKTRSDKAFLRVCACLFAAQVADIATAFTLSMGKLIPPGVNMLLNTIYYLCSLASAVAFERYIASYIFEEKQNSFYEYARVILIGCYTFFILLNNVTKWVFSFDADTGEYIHGPLYYTVYIIPFLIVMGALYLILRYRNKFDVKQFVSCISFVVVIFVGMFLQGVVFPDVYLSYGLIPITLLMIVFSLETPDYRKLIQTMAELEAAKEEAYRASQVKSDFLANMSHEIRTPINAVLGFDEMILRESREADTLAYAGNIKTSGKTLLSLVNDILDFSKIEAGKMEIVPVAYDTAPMLHDLLREIRPRAEAKDLYIVCDVDERLPCRLFGDDVRIRQVVTNLLTNAVKYTEKGGITFRVRMEDEAAQENGEVRLSFSVRDTGVGIRAEDREKLFNAFERLHEQRNRNIEGTGLGLTITTRCLTLMGSKLEFESEYGKGSDFHFLLTQGVVDAAPIGRFQDAVSTAPVEIYREDFTAPDTRVLVVDDVELNLRVFVGLLKRTKIQIDTANSGEAAIGMLRENAYDCVFMDHLMPDMDGIETLAKIREEKVCGESVPIIALTANAIAGAREMYLGHGFSDYLTKPIDGQALSDMLKKWLPREKIREAAEEEAILEFPPDESAVPPVEDAKNSGLPQPDGGDVLSRLEAEGFHVSDGLSYAMSDKEFYIELLQLYADAFSEKRDALETAFDRRDWNTYRVTVHAVKSSSKTVGADRLFDLAAELETAAVEEDAAFIEQHHKPFLSAYERAAAGIRAVLSAV